MALSSNAYNVVSKEILNELKRRNALNECENDVKLNEFDEQYSNCCELNV